MPFIGGPGALVPRPKKQLTILLARAPSGEVLASGIVEDDDIFRNSVFRSVREALHYFRRYSGTYNVTLNIPNNLREES